MPPRIDPFKRSRAQRLIRQGMTESEVRRTTGLGRDAVRRIATETKAPKKKAPSL